MLQNVHDKLKTSKKNTEIKQLPFEILAPDHEVK